MVGLRVIARMLSGKHFFKADIKVGYGLRRFSFGLSFTTLWRCSDPQGTAVSQK